MKFTNLRTYDTIAKSFAIFLWPLFSQAQDFEQTPIPQPHNIITYGTQTITPHPTTQSPPTSYFANNQSAQNQALITEIDKHIKERSQAEQKVSADIAALSAENGYSLPSLSKIPGTEYYRSAFDKLLAINVENYSVRDVNFLVENAFYCNKQNEAEFKKVIKQSGDFLRAKMQEQKFDANSNLAKNHILFQFFAEKMKLKARGQEHYPFKYDFNDYMGQTDWSNMFVSKLIKTGSGQCHSLPLLYLIMAEEIDAEAFLALSPNHTYIKFHNENGKWYNLELTNGMFTTNSFILNSGFIKAEAMQHKIYMQSLSKKQLLSMFLADLAAGYQHKFGYDSFFETVIKKALELYPDNIPANQMLANYDTVRFEYVMKQLKINPRDKGDLQRIRNFPQAVNLLNETNGQYQKIDDLGFEFMSAEAYEKWLGSLQQEKNKRDSQDMEEQFKGIIKQKPRD